jgi:hypothetical protein
MATPSLGPDAEALLARLVELERRLDKQEAELRALRGSDDAGPSIVKRPDQPPATTDRRHFVRTAAAAATGAVAGAALLAEASPASAANNDALIIGSVVNAGTAPTGLAVGGTDVSYGVGVTDNGLNTAPPGFSALLGHAKSTAFTQAVLGLAEGSADAVVGTANGGRGVFGSSQVNTGVEGRSVSSIGVAGLSTGGVGGEFEGHAAALRVDVGSLTAPPARTDSHFPGELDPDVNGNLWYCAVAGSPGGWRKLAGPATAGSLHVLASTIRVYDSRPGFDPPGGTKGQLGANQQRTVDCKIGSAAPAGAAAVLANVTIVSASALGFLAAFKNGITWPGNSTINWDHPGQTAANNAVVALDTSARFQVRASNPVDYIVDVVGYYQ